LRHSGWGEIARVPERGEHAVGRRRRVVDGEGEDEVEAEEGIDEYVGELDVGGLRVYVLPEHVPVRRSSWWLTVKKMTSD
jgi:hypothetical protein